MKEFFKFNWLKILLVFVVIGLDLLTKEIFYLTDYTILPYIIGTRTVDGLNTGGAFSMLSDQTWFLILISLIFIAIIVIFDLVSKIKSKIYDVAVGFIVGGAVGNLIDRLFLGGVRDFIYFDFWQIFPTFNVADSFLFIGTVFLVIYTIFIYKPKDDKK